MFIGLEGGIDGLIHLSDISWTETSEEAVKKYKKGDSVESLIISIDIEKERISLGIKQLTDDPNPESNTENKVEIKTESEKKSSKPKAAPKKEAAPKAIENAGTTNLGALLKAKLDDGK
jgi:small subunit ribosomal protein S1